MKRQMIGMLLFTFLVSAHGALGMPLSRRSEGLFTSTFNLSDMKRIKESTNSNASDMTATNKSGLFVTTVYRTKKRKNSEKKIVEKLEEKNEENMAVTYNRNHMTPVSSVYDDFSEEEKKEEKIIAEGCTLKRQVKDFSKSFDVPSFDDVKEKKVSGCSGQNAILGHIKNRDSKEVDVVKKKSSMVSVLEGLKKRRNCEVVKEKVVKPRSVAKNPLLCSQITESVLYKTLKKKNNELKENKESVNSLLYTSLIEKSKLEKKIKTLLGLSEEDILPENWDKNLSKK